MTQLCPGASAEVDPFDQLNALVTGFVSVTESEQLFMCAPRALCHEVFITL